MWWDASHIYMSNMTNKLSSIHHNRIILTYVQLICVALSSSTVQIQRRCETCTRTTLIAPARPSSMQYLSVMLFQGVIGSAPFRNEIVPMPRSSYVDGFDEADRFGSFGGTSWVCRVGQPYLTDTFSLIAAPMATHMIFCAAL